MTEFEHNYWVKRGAEDYHADERPLFSRDQKGMIHGKLAETPSRWDEPGREHAEGEAYLAGWEAEARRYQ